MARSRGGMWRVVGSALAAFLFFFRLQDARLVDCFLRSGACLQLSALHGHNLSRLPPCRRFPQISNLHRPYDGSTSSDRTGFALLAGTASLDFHSLSHVESVALQRPKLRPVYDVCPPRRRESQPAGTQRTLRRIYRLISCFVCRLPHGRFLRAATAPAYLPSCTLRSISGSPAIMPVARRNKSQAGTGVPQPISPCWSRAEFSCSSPDLGWPAGFSITISRPAFSFSPRS